jgi:hypothetical protein
MVRNTDVSVISMSRKPGDKYALDITIPLIKRVAVIVADSRDEALTVARQVLEGQDLGLDVVEWYESA